MSPSQFLPRIFDFREAGVCILPEVEEFFVMLYGLDVPIFTGNSSIKANLLKHFFKARIAADWIVPEIEGSCEPGILQIVSLF